MSQHPYHIIWSLLLFGWLCNYMIRMAFGPLLGPVIAEFGISHAQAGLLFSVFFYGYIAMQIPAGLLGDRYGHKRVLVIGILLVAVGTLATGLAPTLTILALSRLFTGLAQGIYLSNDRPIIAAATPTEKMAVGQGLSFSGLGLGTALGVALGGTLGEVLPWRRVFLILAILPVIAAALISSLVREPVAEHEAKSLARAARNSVLRNRDLWLLGLAGMAPVWSLWLMGAWGPALFADLGVKELGRAALYSSLLGVAAAPGLFALGHLSDRLNRRGIGRKAVVGAACVCIAAAVATMGISVQLRCPVWWFALTLFVASFFTWGIWAPIFALVAEIAPARIMGLGFGLVNSVAFLASLLAPYVTGWLKDYTGSFIWGCYVASVFALLGVPMALSISGHMWQLHTRRK